MFIPFMSRASWRLAPVCENQQPSGATIAAAQAIGEQIIRCVENRTAVVDADHSIDRAFAIPAANWDSSAPNDYQRCYGRLAKLTWDELRFLRFRCQSFTGNNLIRMGDGRGTEGSAAIPNGFEALWGPETRDKIFSHWQALTREMSANLVLRVPNILGETGWWFGRSLVNRDVIDYQERINLLSLADVFNRFGGQTPRILEIGGGYGALALALNSMLRSSQYVICDLPESLLFSGLYLRIAQESPVRLHETKERLELNRNEICLLPNYLAQIVLTEQRFDLVLNTLSMSEMSEHQVRIYAAIISKAIGTTGIFFEQNHDNRHLGLIDCRDYLGDYFRQKAEIDPGKMPVTRGTAVVWSN